METIVADIFISYSSEEPEVTERLADTLKARGYAVWWDVTLKSGDDFGDIIQERLRESKAAIVIWTKASIKSKWVRAEAQIAARAGKLVPVRAPDLSVDDIPPPYNILHTDVIDDVDSIVVALKSHGVHSRERDIAVSLGSDDPTLRMSALTHIAARGVREHFDRIIHCLLSDPSDAVRERAAWALDNLNDRRSIPALVQALHDPNWGVRSGAGWALVHLGESVRAEMERVARESDNPDARQMAMMVLRRL
jgi:hypothetical protein